jgi:uncharacterized protein (TIGR03437 family)
MGIGSPQVKRAWVRRALMAALPIVLLAPVRAQFSGLSSTDDGSRVYFASPLRQRGTNQFLWSKIFRIDANGAALVAQVARSSPVPPTNAYVLDQPQVTGDGRLLLYRGKLDCVAGSSCFLSEQHSTTLLDTTTSQISYAGPNASISRNGRYLASYNSGNVFDPQFSLIDRSSNTTTLFQDKLAPATVSIASDGTTVLTFSNMLQLIRAGTRTTMAGAYVAAAVIDDAATTIVYESGKRLFVMDLKSSRTQELGPGDRDSFQATLSADGHWVAYLSTLGTTAQVFYSRLDGTNWKQLTARSDGIVEATLSGDGTTVFAITADGSMLQIDTTTGNTTILVGPTPAVNSVQFTTPTTPGSLTSIQGSRLDNASIGIAGLAAPILSRSANEILFQVPWETPPSADAVTISGGGAPYFEIAIKLSLQAFAPQLIYLPPDPTTGIQPIAIHIDWESPVTSKNPAAPGEIVHLYLTGGGPVNPPVATGVPAPLQPLSPITTPFYVTTLENVEQPLDVLYFGLAPGLVGVWQMDVMLPSPWTRPFLSIWIVYGQSYGAILDSIPMKPVP